MKFLLDTHAWLWMMLEPTRIGPRTRVVLAEPDEFCLSTASAWEIAIKHAAGRLVLPEPPYSYILSRTKADGVRLLGIEVITFVVLPSCLAFMVIRSTAC